MARKANNPQNLKPFKKGQSGNPNGRPLKLPDLDQIMIKVLNEPGSNGLNKMERIFKKLADKAEAGDIRAIELIHDRAYGKLKTMVGVTGAINFPTLPEDQLDQIAYKLDTLNKK
jgi:hypothetical protein